MNKYYLRVEAVNLNNFIADTQDLNTIRGGSLLLLDAVDDLPHNLKSVSLTTLTTGGSAGLYAFGASDDKSAEAILGEVETYLKSDEKLKHATFVADIQPCHDDGSFSSDLETLISRNHWKQMQMPSVTWDEDVSLYVCEKDLVRPATTEIAGPKSKLSVSRSVEVRRKDGQKRKQDFYNRQIGTNLQTQFTNELNELTADESKGNLNGKMAVIYLDGNHFGKIKESVIDDPRKWLRFDSDLKEYYKRMLSSLLELMKNDLDWQTRQGHYRIETLMWGGDEILWVVPAWKGWEMLAYFYCSSVRWEFNGKPLRYSGGLVFCRHKAPIHRIIKLAMELASLAKESNREENRFAYEVLESFDHIGRGLKKYREERVPQPVDPTQTINSNSLIMKGNNMLDLLKFANAIGMQLPRKQVHALADDLLTKTQVHKDQSSIEIVKQRIQNRNMLLDKLSASLRQAGISAEMVKQIASKVGGEEVLWLHLIALSDYLIREQEDAHA